MGYPGGLIPELQKVYHTPGHWTLDRLGRAHHVAENWRVGLNWRSGQGQYPVANGIFHALSHINRTDTWIKVWGVPYEYYPSEEVDEEGRVWRSYKVRTLDLARRLVGDPALHVRSLSSGQYGVPDLGPDQAVADALTDEVQDGWEEIHAVVLSREPF